MTETIPSAVYGKTLTIGKEFNRGGQGIIWNTDDERILVKQFEPAFISDNTKQQNALRRQAARAYTAFCAVNKGHQAALRCLPREYLTFRGKPAYLMQKAEGELLQTILRNQTITADNKVPLAQALASAMHKLRAAQLVHADPNPENYVVKHDQTGWTVSVLDIDGGGLLSPPGPIYPMSQPKRIYKAPELATMHWKTLHERGYFFAPDQWALAVLLYQILVDYAGPFCPVRKHPNPAVKDYIPFKTYAYRDPSIQWPLPWQVALLRQATLSDQIIALFYETFQHRFDLEKRPTAARWEAALRSATTPPPRWTVYTVLVKAKAALHQRPAAHGGFLARRTSVKEHARAFLKGLMDCTHLPARRAGRHRVAQGRRRHCGLRRRPPEGTRTNAS
jgi:serine/threonine protein kinase